MDTFWKPKGKVKSFGVMHVGKYPKRSHKENKLIKKSPYKDSDKDGVMNWYDCKPLARKKQDMFGNVKQAVEAAKQAAMPTIKAGVAGIHNLPSYLPKLPKPELPTPGYPERPKLPVPPGLPKIPVPPRYPPKLPLPPPGRPPKLPPGYPERPRLPTPPKIPLPPPGPLPPGRPRLPIPPKVPLPPKMPRQPELPVKPLQEMPTKRKIVEAATEAAARAGTHWETIVATKGGVERRLRVLVDDATGKVVRGPAR